MAFAEEPHTNRTATAKAHEDRDLLATLDWESGGLRRQIPVSLPWLLKDWGSKIVIGHCGGHLDHG